MMCSECMYRYADEYQSIASVAEFRRATGSRFDAEARGQEGSEETDPGFFLKIGDSSDPQGTHYVTTLRQILILA